MTDRDDNGDDDDYEGEPRFFPSDEKPAARGQQTRPPRDGARPSAGASRPGAETKRPVKPQVDRTVLRGGFQRGAAARAPKTGGTMAFDFQNRQGKYLFTVGMPGSGKSVMQWQLLRYLDQGGKYHFMPILPEDPTGAAASVMRETFNQWQLRWSENRFPERTEVRPSEFRFSVGVLDKSWPEIEFGFFEVAGEHFEKFRQGLAGEQQILDELKEVLSNKNCQFVIALVCIGQTVRQDDLLFAKFLDYLIAAFGEHYLRHSRVIVVISDPEKAAALLADARGARPGEILDKEAFAEEFLKATLVRLRRFKTDYAMAQFDVGPIFEDDKGEYIDRVSFEDAEIVMDWMYENFTGRDPNAKPMIDRLLGLFRRLG